MKRVSIALVALAFAVPIFSQVTESWVECLDDAVQTGDYVRVSGGVPTPTPTPLPPTATPTIPTPTPPPPTDTPTVPTATPTVPTATPTVPTATPTIPTATPPPPTATPTPSPEPTLTPTPSPEPTLTPTPVPTEVPTEEPTEEPTEVPTEEPTEEPTEVPTEEPTEEPTEIAKLAQAETYTLCLVPNGEWFGVDTVDCAECLATTEVVTETGTFTEELLGPIPAPGDYDVLLLDGTCPGSPALLASDDEGTGPAVVAAEGTNPIPSIMVPGVLVLLALLALSGAVILRRG